ncbi:hypothetical protein MGH68_04390 [Erysipelothrix sp. D19-032]
MDTVRLLLIFGIIVFFIAMMMKKKIPTIIALPMMGFLVAFVASIGVVPMAGLFDYPVMVDGVEKMTPGIFSFVITDGVKMMVGAIATVIFASAFSKMLMKQNVVEKIIKTAMNMLRDRPLVLALVFYVVVSVIFMAIGGLGSIILVGSIILPIMLSAGIKPLHVMRLFSYSHLVPVVSLTQ